MGRQHFQHVVKSWNNLVLFKLVLCCGCGAHFRAKKMVTHSATLFHNKCNVPTEGHFYFLQKRNAVTYPKIRSSSLNDRSESRKKEREEKETFFCFEPNKTIFRLDLPFGATDEGKPRITFTRRFTGYFSLSPSDHISAVRMHSLIAAWSVCPPADFL